MATPELDDKIYMYVRSEDKRRWADLASEEEIETAQWIRRSLRRAPERDQPLRLEEEGPFDTTLTLRLNSDAKNLYADRAHREGLTLAAWVRQELNAAADREEQGG